METKINPQIWDIPGKYSSLKKMVRMLGAVGGLTVAISGLPVCAHAAPAAPKKPNIVVLWGDDIGYWNISAYNQGMMGYKTPNIDRLAKEGVLFTDWYGEQNCTAGRSAFITGQSGYRTGNLKVGLPGAKEGLQARDVTIAELLKAQGYATAQFGKNHLGDADNTLPTARGFDEYMGKLYHLNAEKKFENPELIKQYATPSVIHTYAMPDGTQKIESLGLLDKTRRETIDEEITKASLDYLDKAAKSDKPFFLWWNSTRCHIWTHLKKESDGKTGLGTYPDAMVEHDGQVGQLLDKLKELGLDENTIVMYSTDNGAEKGTWPDGGQAPFRGEKNTLYEGGYRVPCAIRWPGVIKPGTSDNNIYSHMDMLPTILAAVGVPDVKEQLLKGMQVGDKTFKVHLDGYNMMPFWKGEIDKSPRHEFFYFTGGGSLVALRYNQYKIVFAEERAHGMEVGRVPFMPLRMPKIFNLRSDPFEEGDHSVLYEKWRLDHVFTFVPAQQYIRQFLATFKEFPPSQQAGSFSIDNVLENLSNAQGNNGKSALNETLN